MLETLYKLEKKCVFCHRLLFPLKDYFSSTMNTVGHDMKIIFLSILCRAATNYNDRQIINPDMMFAWARVMLQPSLRTSQWCRNVLCRKILLCWTQALFYWWNFKKIMRFKSLKDGTLTLNNWLLTDVSNHLEIVPSLFHCNEPFHYEKEGLLQSIFERCDCLCSLIFS